MMSILESLDDHFFSLATSLFAELCREIEAETGEKPTIAELCEILSWGIRSCSADLFKDVEPANVVGLKAEVKRRGKTPLRLGDLVAIPAPGGGCFRVVFLAKNTHGWAFGIFRGRYPLRPPAASWRPEILTRPVYTDQRAVTDGRWRIIGNAPDLTALFPDVPYYYAKRHHRHNDEIGPHGAVESLDGSYRQLTAEEAAKVGLDDPRFENSCMCEQFVIYLEEMIGNDPIRPD